MLAKIANLTTLRGLSGFSRILVKNGNSCALRSFSNKLATPICSGQLKCMPKSITFKNSLFPSSSQFTKIVGNNLIQTRSSSSQGDHVNLWKFERLVAASFIFILPLGFLTPNTVFDTILALTTVMHIHWGLEAVIVDYARPIVVGNVVPKVCMASLYLISALTLAGLLVLTFNGPGICCTIRKGWEIGKD